MASKPPSQEDKINSLMSNIATVYRLLYEAKQRMYLNDLVVFGGAALFFSFILVLVICFTQWSSGN